MVSSEQEGKSIFYSILNFAFMILVVGLTWEFFYGIIVAAIMIGVDLFLCFMPFGNALASRYVKKVPKQIWDSSLILRIHVLSFLLYRFLVRLVSITISILLAFMKWVIAFTILLATGELVEGKWHKIFGYSVFGDLFIIVYNAINFWSDKLLDFIIKIEIEENDFYDNE